MTIRPIRAEQKTTANFPNKATGAVQEIPARRFAYMDIDTRMRKFPPGDLEQTVDNGGICSAEGMNIFVADKR